MESEIHFEQKAGGNSRSAGSGTPVREATSGLSSEKGKRRLDAPQTLFSIGLLVVTAGLLLYYNLVTVRQLLSTDAATKVLVADEMIRQGRMLLEDWNYVNGDLWLYFSNVLILPIVYRYGIVFGAHVVAGIASALILLGLAYVLLRKLGLVMWKRILTVSALASGVSYGMAWALFGEHAYGWVLFTSIAFLVLLLSAIDAETSRGRSAAYAATFLLSVLVHANSPSRALASYTLPAAAALIAVYGSQVRNAAACLQAFRLPATQAVAWMVCGGIVGALLHKFFLDGLINWSGAGTAAFLPLDRVLSNAGYTLFGLIAVLGGEPPEGVRLTTLAGAYAAGRLFLAVAVLAVPWIVFWRAWRSVEPRRRLAAIYAATAFGIVLFVCLTTNTPDYSSLSAARGSVRYLVPSLMLALLVAATMLQEPRVTRGPAIILLATAIVVVATSPLVLIRGGDVAMERTRDSVLALLRKEGLKYGYATYWNSGVFTVLSGGDVKVRQVVISDRLYAMRHLSSDLWYQGSAWQGPTFLLVDEREHKLLEDRRLLDCPLRPDRVLTIDSLRILIYPANIAASAIGWDNSDVSWTWPICLNRATPRSVGSFDPQRRALVSQEGEIGYLMFGPYLSLRPGHYSAILEYEGLNAVGHVDVAAGGKVLASEALRPGGGARQVQLNFQIDTRQDGVELRVLVSGPAVAIKSASFSRVAARPGK